ncbi:hypothetical protein ACFQ2B_40015 [Streptomyces stramineus]
MLHRVFGKVTTVRYDNASVFPRPEPLADFAVALLPFNGCRHGHRARPTR